MASERPNKLADTTDWRRLRLWHIQPVRDLLVLSLVFGVFYLGYVLRAITVPMLLALLLAYLFEPLVKKLTRSRHFSRPGAALSIIAAFLMVVIVPLVIGISVGVVQTVGVVQSVAANTTSLAEIVREKDDARRVRRIENLPRGWRGLGEQLSEFRDHIVNQRVQQDAASSSNVPIPLAPPEVETPPDDDPAVVADGPSADTAESSEEVADEPAELPEWKRDLYAAAYTGIEWTRTNADNLAKALGQTALATGQGAIATAVAFFGALAFLSFGLFLTCFFFFFFSTGWGKVLDFWAGFIPERKKGVAFDLITQMDRVIAGFVRGRLTICAIMALVHTIAYWLIGVPMPLVVGPIAGLLYIVPFLHILTIPIGILLLWLQPSAIEWQNTWWWIIIAPIAVDVSGQFLDDWVLTPTIQGKTTEMDAPTILFASMAGGALAGMYGLLVAIPVAACIKILVKEIFWPKFRRWARGETRDFLPIDSADEATRQTRQK